MTTFDIHGRPLRSLRISVTDRCNLRCQYCMPEEEYSWLERNQLLRFEEIAELASIFSELGVDKIRLTGGEPLLRRDLGTLIRLLRSDDRVRDLALTTNGILLARYASELREAGLRRITVSLDTLRPERFRELTRRDVHAQVLEGLEAARQAGFAGTKLNSVIIRGFNDDELADLIEFSRGRGEVRFIEYMDVGGATRWSMSQVVSRVAMLEALTRRYGKVQPVETPGADPADRYVLPDGASFGIISSTTQPFCGSCDRARLTADGVWLLCLYATRGVDLKQRLRSGQPRAEIAQAILQGWRARADRGAEERLASGQRQMLYNIADLRQDPHLEMHTRGG
jgi:cyclic pyranopterin phosphate synthase